jgi:hypothetical protein
MRYFKFYYLHFIKGILSGYFPNAPSYERFVVIKHRSVPWLAIFMCMQRLGDMTGTYFGNSTKLPVCHNKRIKRHRTFKSMEGECYLDKSYLTTLFEDFLEKGLKFITPIRDNMKNQLVCMKEKLNLRKRSIIETVNGMLKEVLDICHTRHRKPENFLANLMGGLVAYTYLTDKQKSIGMKKVSKLYLPNTQPIIGVSCEKVLHKML